MKAPDPITCPYVRGSTDSDLSVILDWLKRQHEAREVETFWVNRQVIERCHKGGELLVYESPELAEPVAFQLGGLLRPGILEVRHDQRGKGIGQAMAQHCMALAVAENEDILYIQCEPASSIPFWRKMGFSLIGTDETAAYAYRVMPRQLPLAAGTPAHVVVGWYPESAKWEAATAALQEEAFGGLRQDGTVSLPQRVLYPSVLNHGDVVLRITVDGEDWYFDKAKYETAELVGVRQNWNGYRIDHVTHPA